jgi:hypothetical protein
MLGDVELGQKLLTWFALLISGTPNATRRCSRIPDLRVVEEVELEVLLRQRGFLFLWRLSRLGLFGLWLQRRVRLA